MADARLHTLPIEIIFPSLTALHMRLWDGGSKPFDWQLERLPYCTRAMLYAVGKFVHVCEGSGAFVEDERAKAPMDLRPEVACEMGLSPETTIPLALMVDLFLDGARRAQNALVGFIGVSLGCSLKDSMSKVIGKLSKGEPASLAQHSSLCSLLVDYWEKHGKQLKHYRDRVQHTGSIVSDVRFRWDAGGPVQIHVALPNNPSQSSLEALSYEPPVLAYPYMLDELIAFILLARSVIDELLSMKGGAPYAFGRQVISNNFRGGLGNRASAAHVVPTASALFAALEKALIQRDAAISS